MITTFFRGKRLSEKIDPTQKSLLLISVPGSKWSVRKQWEQTDRQKRTRKKEQTRIKSK